MNMTVTFGSHRGNTANRPLDQLPSSRAHPATSLKPRILTVSTVYREWENNYNRTYQAVPALRLTGKWLSKLGFTPGQKVRVVVSPGTIIIEVRAESCL
jgi:hypothetical protein